MPLSSYLLDDGVFVDMKINSKKSLMQFIADKAACLLDLSKANLFDILIEREKLGSTGIGKGVAIPHGRIDNLGGIHCLFIRLARPIDFDAVDGEPVDLFFVLLAPAEAGADHLKALSRISRLLRDPRNADRLRSAKNADAVQAAFAAKDAATKEPE